MLTVYDGKNQSYVLTEQIGRGGEGTVFSCPDNYHLVAKIYHEPISEDKAEKLRWMAENANDHLLKVAAWIIDVLRDTPDGKIVGFLMPNVKAKEIHELYSLKSRRIYFPEATWHFLVHSAANVARAFYSLHKNRHVMGDVNHGNCVVLADGTVKLIDCDSYSISTDKFRYPCEVGVTTHLAPELQGVNLRGVERLPQHDNFGLAVIIFQLLFLGRHPFAGNYLGDVDKSLEDCIREHLFAYGDDAESRKVKQPPGTLPLSAVSPNVAKLFERAFLTDDKRPEPHEWIEALEDLSNNLEQCGLHPGHLYYEKLNACPWCEIESNTGLMLFPFIGGKNNSAAGQESFNIFTIENLIASFNVSQNLPAKPVMPTVLLPPSPEILDVRKTTRKRHIILVAIQLFVVIVFSTLVGFGSVCFVGLILMIFMTIILDGSAKSIKKDLQDRLQTARSEWDKLENEWGQAESGQKLNQEIAQIRGKVTEYQNLHQLNRRKIQDLRDEIFRRRINEYLDSVRLDDAEFLGVENERLAVLKNFGIKTAADIESKRYLLSVPGVDENLASKLVDWRKELERKLDYDSESKISETEQEQLAQETAGMRRKIEKEVEMLLGVLRLGSVNLRHRQQKLLAKSEALANQLLQAESDLSAVGSNAPAIVALVLITFLTPIWGIAFREMLSPPKSYPTGDGISSRQLSVPGIRAEPMSEAEVKPVTVDDLETSPVPENITDKKISLMPDIERQIAADRLYNQSLKLAYEKNEHKKAEQKLRLANRLLNNDIRLLNQLGFVLYEQEKFSESLKYLNQSLKIEPENSATKTYIGMNYLRMKKFSEARRIFFEVTGSDPNSFEGFYNLGLAHQGLGKYSDAVEAFGTAVVLSTDDNDDADAHYELGICLYKIGDSSGAREEYDLLRDKNPNLADKLGRAIGIK